MCKQKKPSEAWIKVDGERDEMNMFEGVIKNVANDFSCVVYDWKSGDRFVVKGFKGRSKKASFVRVFKEEAKRDDYINEFIAENSKQLEMKTNRNTRALKINDVVYSSWGYEQTNINFYLVTKLVGNGSVELQEIDKIKHYTHDDQGTCAPDLSKIIGDPFVRRVTNGVNVKINSCERASILNPLKTIGDKAIYKPLGWSAYA
ncbi:hypothetical protein A3715_14020 [Oleiphilus sp. HI0009]|nr:hypothetical protein A3715_14020 [Oleiphilus sp. HI0009]